MMSLIIEKRRRNLAKRVSLRKPVAWSRISIEQEWLYCTKFISQLIDVEEGRFTATMPWPTQFLDTISQSNHLYEISDLLSTSATLWSRICLRTFGFSSSFSILAMTASASSRCCLCFTCPSYRTHESRTARASWAIAVFCSNSYALASSWAVS